MGILLLGINFFLSASAALLEFSGKPSQVIEVSGQHVPIFSEAIPRLPEGTPPVSDRLQLSGAGVRVVTIVFIDINAYTAAAYFSPALKVKDGEEPFPIVDKSTWKAVHMTFLRDVPKSRVVGSFKKALEANGVDLASKPIMAAFGELNHDLKAGETLTLLAHTTPEKETLWFETPSGLSISTEKGVAGALFKMWFGNPADNGMKALKARLMGK